MKAHRKEETINFRGSGQKELMLKLKKVAEVEGRSVSAQLIKMLEYYLKEK